MGELADGTVAHETGTQSQERGLASEVCWDDQGCNSSGNEDNRASE